MKIKFGYNELVKNLTDIDLVVGDTMLGEEMRNVIFKVYKDSKVEMIGVNQLITFKRTLDSGSYELESKEEDFEGAEYTFMQVRNRALLGYLLTYKTLHRTEVEYVELERINSLNILCRVKETTKEEEGKQGKSYINKYTFNNIAVKQSVMPNINLTIPEGIEMEELKLSDMLYHTRNLLPVMRNDAGLFGQMLFEEDKYIATMNVSFTTFMESKLPNSFRGIKLSYRTILFLDKLFTMEDKAECKKLERYIAMRCNRDEAYLIYDTKLPDLTRLKSSYKKEHKFSIDRVYLKDILKRVSIENKNVEIVVTKDKMEVKNDKSYQSLDLLESENMEEFNGFTFKIMPETLGKLMIGSENEFLSVLDIYICPQRSGEAYVVFTDRDDKWFVGVQIRYTL